MPACSIEELKYRIMMKNIKILISYLFQNPCLKCFHKKHGCELVFTSVENPYYWNSQFMYNVLIIKK